MQNWQTDIKKAQKGDLSAFDDLVKQFRDMAVGYAYSMLGDFQRAEDAAQDAFIQAYRDLHTLKAPSAFPSWLRRIVFKYCDRINRNKQHTTVSIDTALQVEDHAESPFEKISAQDSQDAVLNNVNSLPENERTVTTLFYINGYSMAEVAKYLDVPASTVKSRLHAARTKLKGRMVHMLDETMRRHAPGNEFNKKVRHVLEQVPIVSFQLHKIKPKKGPRRCPELLPFPSCLRACMEYLDDGMGHTVITAHNKEWRLDNTYVFLMGVTGAAFRLSWKSGWEADNSMIGHMSDNPDEPLRRGLKAAGYKHRIIYPNDYDEPYFRKQIIESIRDKGCPVIARGVIGPPEECIITGFDENVDVLIGRSFFQTIRDFNKDVQLEGSGYFRKRNWFDDTYCLILLGDKQQSCSLEKIYRDSLQWAIHVMGTPRVQAGRFNGITAYDALAKIILDDNEFANKKVKELHQRYIVLQDALVPLGEGRWYGHNFLNMIANDIDCPKEELRKAAACFNDEHSLMWEMWKLVGGPGMSVKKAKLFGDRNVRKQTVKILLKSRDRYQTAANHLKRALKLW